MGSALVQFFPFNPLSSFDNLWALSEPITIIGTVQFLELVKNSDYVKNQVDPIVLNKMFKWTQELWLSMCRAANPT